jgi:hypothetical protein
MQILSSQQLAELLIGIARAQAAIVQAVENEMAGFRTSRAGRGGPDATAIAKDLERLCAGQASGGSPGPDLDFSRS